MADGGDNFERIQILLDLQKDAHDKAARASAREIAKLEKVYDPLSAATIRYEQQREKLTKAVAAGTITEKRAAELMNRVQAEYEQSAAKAQRFNDVLDRNKRVGGTFVSSMGANTEALARFGAKATVLAGTLVGGALALSLTGLTAQVRGTVRSIASIGDEARRSGLGVEEFQQLKFVAEQSRIPVDAMVDGMKELNLRADEFAVTGKGSAAEAFARIGMSRAEVRERLKDPSELLLEIVRRLEQVDGAAQIRIADEIFGGTGGERFVELLSKGDDGLRQLMQRARDVGVVLETEMVEKAAELDRKFDELQARLATFGKRLAVAIADTVDDVATLDLADIFGSDQRADAILGPDIAATLRETAGAISEMEEELRGLNTIWADVQAGAERAIGPMLAAANTLNAWGETDTAAVISAAALEMRALAGDVQDGTIDTETFRDRMAEAIERVHEAFDGLSDVDAQELGNVISQVEALAGRLSNARDRAGELSAALPGGDGAGGADGGMADPGPSSRNGYRAGSAPTTSLRPRAAPAMTHELGGTGTSGSGRSGGASSRSSWDREVEATREAIARLTIEAASLTAVAEGGQEVGDALLYARKRAELLYAAQKDGKAITAELTAQVDEMALAYVQAQMPVDQVADRLDRLKENAERGGEAISDMMLGIIDGSTSAGDALRGLLLKIAEVQLQNGLASLVGGGGGFFSWIGGLLTPGRATGGGVAAGRAVKVNEGRLDSEVFVPSQSGAILNVAQAQAALRPSVKPSQQSAPAAMTVSMEPTSSSFTFSDDGQFLHVVDVRVKQGQAETMGNMTRRMRTQPKSATGLSG